MWARAPPAHPLLDEAAASPPPQPPPPSGDWRRAQSGRAARSPSTARPPPPPPPPPAASAWLRAPGFGLLRSPPAPFQRSPGVWGRGGGRDGTAVAAAPTPFPVRRRAVAPAAKRAERPQIRPRLAPAADDEDACRPTLSSRPTPCAQGPDGARRAARCRLHGRTRTRRPLHVSCEGRITAADPPPAPPTACVPVTAATTTPAARLLVQPTPPPLPPSPCSSSPALPHRAPLPLGRPSLPSGSR